ncbi:MAG: hypothetical protein GY820_01420 [Gammaproteobacteria bacterium]|nr:hypothetical protein [Gammaproteobacteria bacterium]
MEHPDPQELLDYQEDRLDRDAADRVREHLGTCDWCLDDIEENLTEKLRADLNRLNNLDDKDQDDFMARELRRGNSRLADEPVHREETRRKLTDDGMENDSVFGPLLRLLNEHDERLATLKSERR